MSTPPRLRPSFWPRIFPRTLVKTCILALGVLVWLLYFYSNNYVYDGSGGRRANGGGDSNVRRSDGHILRRPTVPLFEGVSEGDAVQNGSTAPPDALPLASTAGTGDETDAPPTPPTEVRRGDYAVLQNLLEGRRGFRYNQSVTITTHATYELLDNLIYLSKRWNGPISVAVYAPHEDLQTALKYAVWLRGCHPTVRDFVTFHFVYPVPAAPPVVRPPEPSQTQENPGRNGAKPTQKPNGETDRKQTQNRNGKNLANHNLNGESERAAVNQNRANPPTPASSDPVPKAGASGNQTSRNRSEPLVDAPALEAAARFGVDAEALPPCGGGASSYPLPRSYRHRHKLPYPINVCRNVARLNAKTHYVLASDIELYPSAGVVPLFLEFSRRAGLVQEPGWEATEKAQTSSLTSFFLRVAAPPRPVRRVYVLPIFEVDKSVGDAPADKRALVDLYRRKKAVYFHKHVCSFCNIIPRLNRWLVTPATKGRLNVFMSIKRHKPFNRWEPIYIGTNSEPLYDERLSWEGQQDKMSQMYELCLMNYDLAILDNAFLVHRPGIKTKNATEYKLKSPFIAQNNKVYRNIIVDLERKHGANSWCK